MRAARAVSGRAGERKGRRMLTFFFFPFPIQRLRILDTAKKTREKYGGGRGSYREHPLRLPCRGDGHHFVFFLTLTFFKYCGVHRAPSLDQRDLGAWLVAQATYAESVLNKFRSNTCNKIEFLRTFYGSGGTVRNNECASVTASNHFGRPERDFLCFGARISRISGIFVRNYQPRPPRPSSRRRKGMDVCAQTASLFCASLAV